MSETRIGVCNKDHEAEIAALRAQLAAVEGEREQAEKLALMTARIALARVGTESVVAQLELVEQARAPRRPPRDAGR